jgi:hypothetical protein
MPGTQDTFALHFYAAGMILLRWRGKLSLVFCNPLYVSLLSIRGEMVGNVARKENTKRLR